MRPALQEEAPRVLARVERSICEVKEWCVFKSRSRHLSWTSQKVLWKNCSVNQGALGCGNLSIQPTGIWAAPLPRTPLWAQNTKTLKHCSAFLWRQHVLILLTGCYLNGLDLPHDPFQLRVRDSAMDSGPSLLSGSKGGVCIWNKDPHHRWFLALGRPMCPWLPCSHELFSSVDNRGHFNQKGTISLLIKS